MRVLEDLEYLFVITFFKIVSSLVRILIEKIEIFGQGTMLKTNIEGTPVSGTGIDLFNFFEMVKKRFNSIHFRIDLICFPIVCYLLEKFNISTPFGGN